MSFSDYSNEIARDFLLTALVIDDRAFKEEELVELERKQVANSPPLRVPGSEPGASSEESEEGGYKDDAQRPKDRPSSHDLDAPRLVAEFAKIGIFSSVLRPSAAEDAVSPIVELARRADLLILDWQLRPETEDDGQLALDVIGALAREAVGDRSEFSERLAAILIYTGEADLEDIVGKVEQTIHEVAGAKPETLGVFGVKLGGIGVTVFAKDDTPIPEDTPAHARLTSEQELPGHAVDAFLTITAGLVPNAVLKGLAVLRSNTHRLIRVFSKELDGPYLAHRAMLITPHDAEEYLVTLLAEEIGAVLQGSGISDCVSLDAIRLWIEHNWNSLDLDGLLNDGQEAAVSAIVELVGSGANQAAQDVAVLRNQGKRRRQDSVYTKALSPEGLSAQEAGVLDRRFAVVGSLQRQYGETQPFLSLGIVLANRELPEDDERFWLCIQPVCDSVRIQGARAFPLLPLEEPTSARQFDLVVSDGTEFRDLSIQYASHGLRMEEFVPSEGQERVFPSTDSEETRFVAADGERHYRLVGRLKWGQARRVIDRFARRTGRVGLDESEWLRLHRPSR